MTWVKIDDQMPHHPKLVEAGPAAFALDVAAICHASRTQSDGFVPENALPVLLPGVRKPRQIASKLVEVGRWKWDAERRGWTIHDYDQHQLTSEKSARLSQVRAEAGRRGGLRSGQTRRRQREASAKQVASEATKQVASPERSRLLPKQTKQNEADIERDISTDNPYGLSAPSGEPNTKQLASQPDSAATLLAEHIDAHPRRPPERVVGMTAKQIKHLLDEGWTTDQVRAGLTRLRQRRLHPSQLAVLVNEVANQPGNQHTPAFTFTGRVQP